jgi:hypothetical protein
MKVLKFICATALLAALVVGGLSIHTGLKGQEIYHRRMMDRALAAKDVELQWTYRGVPVQSEQVGASNYLEWLAKLPVKRGEVKALKMKCHMPHHVVLMHMPGGNTVSTEICFTCNSIRLEGEYAKEMPAEWRGPFAKRFGEEGIPIDPPGMEVVRKNFTKLPADFQAIVLAEEAAEKLEALTKSESYPGSVYAQSEAAGLDYRKLLREADGGASRESLQALIEVKSKAALMGEAAETHAEVLLLLMLSWGDELFAAALAPQPREVQQAVMADIAHAWAEPRWELYPETGKLR